MKIAMVLLLGVMAAAQTPAPASPFPAATYFRDADLMATLKEAAKTAPELHTAPVHNSNHYRINLVERTVPTGATAHPGFIEVHHIISGSGTLVTGGTMVAANAGRGGTGPTIEGGVSRHVAAGDVILVPAGSPHWYKDVDAPITYLETRFEEVK